MHSSISLPCRRLMASCLFLSFYSRAMSQPSSPSPPPAGFWRNGTAKKLSPLNVRSREPAEKEKDESREEIKQRPTLIFLLRRGSLEIARTLNVLCALEALFGFTKFQRDFLLYAVCGYTNIFRLLLRCCVRISCDENSLRLSVL